MNPTLIQMARDFQDAGGHLMVVGGAVRDMHLGIQSKDLDVEVYGLDQDEIARVLDGYGEWKATGKRFGVFKIRIGDWDYDVSMPRTDNKTGRGRRGFMPDLNKNLSPAEAARRRDYTMNAMYYDPLTEQTTDLYGGLVDLKHHVLRATDVETLIEDPTRGLRGMRFCGQCDLTADNLTIAAVKTMLDEYDAIAPEMVWVEWEKWAERSIKPSRGLEFLDRSGWLDLYPELEALCWVDQHPIHHPEGTVWKHTLQVVDELAGQGAVKVLAGLCHDMGKVTATEGCGTDITSNGHDQEGVIPAYWFLQRIGAPEKIIEQVIPLVREHMFQDNEALTKRAVRRLSSRLEPATIEQLSDLMVADRLGRQPPTYVNGYCRRCGRELTDPESIKRGIGPDCLKKWQARNVLALAKELRCEASKPKPILMGKHLLEWGYMDPGPEMGEFLRFAYHWQMEGVINDLDDAKSFAYQVFGHGGASIIAFHWEEWNNIHNNSRLSVGFGTSLDDSPGRI